MEKNVGICDVSVFVSKSKFAEVKRTIENLGIQDVVMPKELVDILLKVYREEELSGEEVRVLSYWSRGPVPQDEEIKGFFEELLQENMKIRTVSEYIIKKEVEYGYKELEEGEHHEEMEIFDKTWRTLFNSFSEFLPEMTAVIIAKILAISLVFNVKILAFNKRILNFLKDANLIISKVETTLEIEKKKYVYVLLLLRGYTGTEYVDIFSDVKRTMGDSMKVPFDLERSAGSVIVLFG